MSAPSPPAAPNPPSSSILSRSARSRWWLEIAGAIALSILLCAAYAVINEPSYEWALNSDFSHYDHIARSLLDGNGYTLQGQPAILRGPGFPVWIAAVYGVTGKSFPALIAVQIGLVAVIVWLTALLGRQFGGDGAGVVAAYVAAVNPILIHYSIRAYSEPLFTVLSLASVLIVGPALRRVVWWRVVMSGLLAGLACLVRPQMLIFPFFLLLWWLWRIGWRGLIPTAAFTATMWLPVLPWSVRNYVVTGHVIVVQVQSGHVLWASNNERVLRDPVEWGYYSPPVGSGVGELSPSAPVEEQLRADREERQAALRFLRANVHRIPKLVALKFLRFLSLGTSVGAGRKLVLYALDLPLLPLALLGILLLLRRDTPELGAALAVLAMTLATVAVFWGDSRFRFTIVPYVVALASVSLLAAWWRRIRPRAIA